jgi:hypothetical protein
MRAWVYLMSMDVHACVGIPHVNGRSCARGYTSCQWTFMRAWVYLMSMDVHALSRLTHSLHAFPHPAVDGAVPLPGGIKFLIASFAVAFGTADGLMVQKWCVDNGWMLVWALGAGLEEMPHGSFTNGDWYSFNHRAVDPDVISALGSATNQTDLAAATKESFDALWAKVARLRNTTTSDSSAVPTKTSPSTRLSREDIISRAMGAGPAAPPSPHPSLNFTALWQGMPPTLATAPMRAGQCAEPTRCIGALVHGDDDCICYSK